MRESNSFDSESFWAIFRSDLASARSRVLLQSPFVSTRRLRDLLSSMGLLVKRRVTICLFVQEPRFWNASRQGLSRDTVSRLDELKENLDILEDMRIHVNLEEGIHAKLAVIDESVLWEGSLNILSHTNTLEQMRRITDRGEIDRAANQLDRCATCRFHSQVVNQEFTPLALARRLKRHRRQEGLSQRQLSRKCGLSTRRLAQIETGLENISIETMQKLATEFGLVPILIPRILFPTVSGLLSEQIDLESL